MSQATAFEHVVQISKVRINTMATVDLLNTDGSIAPVNQSIVVQFPLDTKALITKGSVWAIKGKSETLKYTSNGFNVTETLIKTHHVKFLKPSGNTLARWISRNIAGIGDVIAKRLVRQGDLVANITDQNTNALLEVAGMTTERADALFAQWPDQALYDTITWVEEQNLPLGIGDKIAGLLGSDSIDRIKKQPFLLLTMGVSFKKAADIAQKLGFSVDDDEYLLGVAQYAIGKYENKTGSTVITHDELQSSAEAIVKKKIQRPVGEIACDYGFLVKVETGYQVYGTALMEAAVAQFLVDTLHRKPSSGSLVAGWEQTITKNTVIDAFDNAQTSLPFRLTDEQKQAVIEATLSPVCCLSGGAGTGKTVILRILIDIYEALNEGLPIYQVALAGRAAQRMAEATGRPAQTIAGFVNNHMGEHKQDLPEHLLLIIDEASMVDLLSMYRLISILPAATRIVFVGDVAQLPPVGKGLIFHSMVNSPIPFFELSKVRRQGTDSGIHKFATSVREGQLILPSVTQTTLSQSADCSYHDNIDIDKMIALWEEAGGIQKAIVLSPVKSGDAGVSVINKRLQVHVGVDRQSLSYQNDNGDYIPWITSSGTTLLLGDPILVTQNMYDKDTNIRNGDLGILSEINEHPVYGGPLGVMVIDGREVEITLEVADVLQLGYAITIHKSQGSQWETCFITLPKEARRMTDQSLLYTASTRPTKKLVIMGEKSIMKEAIARGSDAQNRVTFLEDRIAAANNAMECCNANVNYL